MVDLTVAESEGKRVVWEVVIFGGVLLPELSSLWMSSSPEKSKKAHFKNESCRHKACVGKGRAVGID